MLPLLFAGRSEPDDDCLFNEFRVFAAAGVYCILSILDLWKWGPHTSNCLSLCSLFWNILFVCM